MALRYSIDPDARLVTVVFETNPTFEEWRDTMLSIFADPRYRPGFNFLGDRRPVTVPFDREYIARSVEWLNGHADQLRGARWAGLFSMPASYGMGRVGQVYSEGSAIELGVFLDEAEALRWLRREADRKSG